ncbi:zinc ribbon domain-containing protein [bacterium]|nr:zinc ribbon domain-containing protein [bacterium]
MAKYCSQCGYALNETDKFCENCGTPVRSRLDTDYYDHYCSECGAPIRVRTAEAVPGPSTAGAPPRVEKPLPAPPPAEKPEAEKPSEAPARRTSGCGFFFLLLIIAALVYVWYVYIYAPTMQIDADPGVAPAADRTMHRVIPGPADPIVPIDSGEAVAPGVAGEGKVGEPGDSIIEGDEEAEAEDDYREKYGFYEIGDADEEAEDSDELAAERGDDYATGPFDDLHAPFQQLELVEFEWGVSSTVRSHRSDRRKMVMEGRQIAAEGEVLNLSDKTLKGIEVVVNYYDISGRLITTATGTLDRDDLPAGEFSRFKVYAEFSKRMYKAEIEFRHTDGAAIPTRMEEAYAISVE